MELEFYRCKHCGQIVAIVKKAVCTVHCCGEAMEKIVPGTTDAAAEKHVPVVEVNGNIATVKVGSVAHPMLEEHYIEWIVLQTETGNHRKQLKPGSEPKADFALLDGDKVVGAYAYCNLHSLWKS